MQLRTTPNEGSYKQKLREPISTTLI
jgi:hypothetical protein